MRAIVLCLLLVGCGKSPSVVTLTDGTSVIQFQRSEYKLEVQFTADFNGSGCKMWLAAYDQPDFHRTNRSYSIQECTSGYREEGYYYRFGDDLVLCREYEEEKCTRFNSIDKRHFRLEDVAFIDD